MIRRQAQRGRRRPWQTPSLWSRRWITPNRHAASGRALATPPKTADYASAPGTSAKPSSTRRRPSPSANIGRGFGVVVTPVTIGAMAKTYGLGFGIGACSVVFFMGVIILLYHARDAGLQGVAAGSAGRRSPAQRCQGVRSSAINGSGPPRAGAR